MKKHEKKGDKGEFKGKGKDVRKADKADAKSDRKIAKEFGVKMRK